MNSNLSLVNNQSHPPSSFNFNVLPKETLEKRVTQTALEIMYTVNYSLILEAFFPPISNKSREYNLGKGKRKYLDWKLCEEIMH